MRGRLGRLEAMHPARELGAACFKRAHNRNSFRQLSLFGLVFLEELRYLDTFTRCQMRELAALERNAELSQGIGHAATLISWL
jgi:hypothetical protein